MNPDEFAETLKRAVPERTSLYTGTYDVGERELAEIVGLVGELLDGS